MPSEKDVDRFLQATFRSIWSMELLFLLSRDAARCWASTEIVSALRASDLVVSQAIADLVAAGLVVPVEEDCYRYNPSSEELDGLVAAAQELYARSPDAVRRLIIRARSEPLAAFSDAFKLRRE